MPRYVYFYIEGGDLHPDEVSERLGVVVPDKVRVKGAINPHRRIAVPYPHNSWSLVENGGSEADISELLSRLHERVAHIKDGIKKLVGVGIGVVIVAYFTPEDPVGPGFEIEPGLLSIINELDGRFTVDLYVLGQEDEDSLA